MKVRTETFEHLMNSFVILESCKMLI